ncbi:MAG: peptidoglycan-binding domain-containing protein [Candidatus Omnitrophica bacterium]|nr:peptidoglycan-binding domain-containing protein [Candidatus Omnitrophota bacterium]
MKRLLVVVSAVLVLAALSACGKKQEMEELQPITMESLSAPSASVPMQPAPASVVPVTASASKEIMPLPPQGPYKPTGIEIQTALKQAGFYTGNIDNKIGPKTKQAIEDFQKANGLQVDGKVGPKTWEALSKYLAAAVEPVKR